MERIETINHLINMIEYCKKQLVLVDADFELSFQEKQERKDYLRHHLRNANSAYYQISSEFFKRVA